VPSVAHIATIYCLVTD